jgi:predicted SprT family Zn-dependent metalloprotease
MVDRKKVMSIVQRILDKEFKSPEKRRIHEYADRLNYACPVCQDSKDDRKKRGNLYLNRLYHICFNCGAKCAMTSLDPIV